MNTETEVNPEYIAERAYLDHVRGSIESQAQRRAAQIAGASRQSFSAEDVNAAQGNAWELKLAQKASRVLQDQKNEPYFGRFDFQETEAGAPLETFYIGKASLYDEKNAFLVYDWRAPVSSVYYRYGVGPASYRAPAGQLNGRIDLKRRYEIKEGALVNVYNDRGAKLGHEDEEGDQMLLGLLGRNTTGQMRQIVQSIQGEQDAIIRTAAEVLAVQGPAGSGKTVVALHRAAYLLYMMRERSMNPSQRDQFISAQRMLVFSPNGVFSSYIAQVLPDLQEDQIQQVILESFLQRELRQICQANRETLGTVWRIETKDDHSEYFLESQDDPHYAARREGSYHKSSLAMRAAIIAYVNLMESEIDAGFENVMSTTSFAKNGKPEPLFLKADMARKFHQRAGDHRVSLIARVKDLVEAIDQEVGHLTKALAPPRARKNSGGLERLLSEEQRARIESDITLLRAAADRQRQNIARLESVGPLSRYRDFWVQSQSNVQLVKLPPEALAAMRTGLLTAFSEQRLPYEDLIPLLLLHGFVRGFPGMGGIEHAIVDEAQDYSPIHFEYLRNCLADGCSMTIVGDTNQAANPFMGLDDYAKLASVYGAGSVKRLELTRSYRSSQEITDFAGRILGDHVHVENVRRTGTKPQLHALASDASPLPTLQTIIDGLTTDGMQTVAILCRTRRAAAAFQTQYGAALGATLLSGDFDKLPQGVIVLSVQLAKGLEFDSVLVMDTDAATYGRDEERKLLYTACTRPLHALHLVYQGAPSPLLPLGHEELFEIL
ncbi:MAG: ATP-binding domain-containing protein [Capsulimonas sp.]|uniref:HelD family protein n=1 Tax=Capsulimonas sp. TaxID=2494211 RepID=UPI003262F900